MNDILEHEPPHDEIQLLTDKDQVNFLLAQRIYLMYKQQVIFLTLNPRNTRLLISALNIERLNVPLQMESGLIVMNITADHIKAVCANGEYSLHLRRRKHAVGDAAFSAYMKNNRTGRRLATCFLMRVEYDEEKWIKHYGHPLLTTAHGPSTCTTNTMSSSYSSTEDLELMAASAAAANALAASDEQQSIVVERDESGHIVRSLHVSGACNQYNNNDKNNNNKDESKKKKHEDKKSSEQQQKDQQTKEKKKKSIHHKIRSARKRLVNRGKALLNPYHSRSVVDDNDDCPARLSRVVQVR